MTFTKQPLVWLHVIALALGLAATFGLHLTADQTAAIMAILQALAAAVGWTQVTPTGTQRPWPPSAGKPPIT